MDPLLAIVIAVVVVFVVWGAISSGNKSSRTITLEKTPVCRLTAEQQAEKAAQRNRVMLQLEEAARQRGDVDAQLMGNRMAAINRIPLEVRHGPGMDD